MSDLIYRQMAITELNVYAELLKHVLDDADIVGAEREKYKWGLGLIESCISDMKESPAAQPEQHYDEWCTDCKEYDQERHCCPRWNRVIRETLKDTQPEIIRCKDCKYWDMTWRGSNWAGDCYYCPNVDGVRDGDFYCADAERRTE